jgi:hypothetical protein
VPRPQTPAHNKQLTVAETQRLLTLFTLPRSAQRTVSEPAALSGPAMGTPSDASLVDGAEYWRVPLSLQQAGAWVDAHPPRELHSNGSSQGTGPNGDTSLGYSYADNHASPAWTQAELEISIASAGARASIWRIDGIALWMDPRPRNAPTAAKPLHVTASGACPADDRHADGVPPGSADSLLPSGTPDGALICAYTKSGGDVLTKHRNLAAAAAARLAALVNKISLAHTDGGIYNCPADFATHIVLAFDYPNRSRGAELWLNTSGCTSISNGTIMTGSDGGADEAALLDRVTRLIR